MPYGNFKTLMWPTTILENEKYVCIVLKREKRIILDFQIHIWNGECLQGKGDAQGTDRPL
jgi:hypothetical protein